jgi:uncharacterized protein
MTKPITWFWTILVICFIAAILLYCFQRVLVYNPSKITPTRTAFHAEDMQHIQLMTKDNLSLNAWYKSATATQQTIIIFHGNAGHIGTRMPLARQLIQQGFGVLLLDYRGYGGNPGRPSEQGLYQDARAGMHYLKQQNIPAQSIVLYGESLGTGVATQMAMEYPKACALILQSPYTTLKALGKHRYPWIPIAPWDKFDSISNIKQIHTPVLMFHGDIDKVVPDWQGKALFAAANQPKQWITLKNKAHKNLWTPEFIQTVQQFIHQHCT